MFKLKYYSQFLLLILGLSTIFSTGCNSLYSWLAKSKTSIPILLKTENASKEKLFEEVNRFAKVNSMKANVIINFENTSFASVGISEKYRSASGAIIIQRPSNLYLEVHAPIAGDVARMTSDGTKFRVAILKDLSNGKNLKFIMGTNDADYSKLQQDLGRMDLGLDKSQQEQVSSFANIRPQHLTDATLVRPIDNSNTYTVSTIFQEEDREISKDKKDKRFSRFLVGYYLLDEYKKSDNGDLTIARRFWFDRVGGIRLARQQIFDAKGEIETDVVYGQEGNLAENPEYINLPLKISVTRPKERYKMSLTYQPPVSIGKIYPGNVFVLQNAGDLPEVDLDKKLAEINGTQSDSNTAITNKQ